MHTEVRRSAAQAIRYVLVGLVVYALDLGTFLALNMLGVGPALANVAAKTAGALGGFVLHGTFTFADAGRTEPAAGPGRLGLRRFVRYVILFLANAAGTTLLLVVAVAYFGAPTVPIRIAIDALSIVVAFVVSKYLVFTPR